MILITDDLYGIASRLREIDDDYRVYRNPDKHRFEVHSKSGLQVVCPWEELDARLIAYVRETRVQRLDELMRAIDEENARLELSEERERRDKLEYTAKDLAVYSGRLVAQGVEIPLAKQE